MIDRIDEGWEQVFEAYGTNALPFAQDDIAAPLAAVVEYGELSETSVWALVRLHDGRIGYIEGSCDTTGWDCQSGCSGAVAADLDSIRPKVTDEGAFRLFGETRVTG